MFGEQLGRLKKSMQPTVPQAFCCFGSTKGEDEGVGNSDSSAQDNKTAHACASKTETSRSAVKSFDKNKEV